jgi:hypothetical protein
VQSEEVAGNDVSSPPEHTSLEREWTATLDEAIARLAEETGAQAEQAGIEAGAPKEEVPGRPELGESLREDLVKELVEAALAFWATGIPRIMLKMMPGVIAWWLERRAMRAKPSEHLRGGDSQGEARRLLEIDARFFATVRRVSEGRASRRAISELLSVRDEYAALVDADLPYHLAGPACRSLADASESLARAYESRGETKEAWREYEVAEQAWERVRDEAGAKRCRARRDNLR